jgi:hypothetical protein
VASTLRSCPSGSETVDDIIRKLMDIDGKLDVIIEYLGLTDDEEEEDDS